MTTLTMRIADAIASAKVVVTGTSDDKVTPILLTASWDAEANTLFATDRYCVVAYHVADAEHDGDEQVIIPRELLTWVGKQKPEYDRHVRYTMGQDVVTAELIDSQGTVYGSSVTSRITGNVPPVMRLLNDFKPASDAVPVALNPVLLKRVLTGVTGFGSGDAKKEPITFETSEGYKSKPGPVRITRGPLSILLQPNYLVAQR
jgi:hypothetical protein